MSGQDEWRGACARHAPGSVMGMRLLGAGTHRVFWQLVGIAGLS